MVEIFLIWICYPTYLTRISQSIVVTKCFSGPDSWASYSFYRYSFHHRSFRSWPLSVANNLLENKKGSALSPHLWIAYWLNRWSSSVFNHVPFCEGHFYCLAQKSFPTTNCCMLFSSILWWKSFMVLILCLLLLLFALKFAHFISNLFMHSFSIQI